MSIEDLKTGRIDDRNNSFMTGFTLALVLLFQSFSILAVMLVAVGASIATYAFFARLTGSSLFGGGDFSAFPWLMLGLWMHSPVYALSFPIISSAMALVAMAIASWRKGQPVTKMPYMPFALLTVAIMG